MSQRTPREGASPAHTQARLARPAASMADATSMALSSELQALGTSKQWARVPRRSCTAWDVAGSTMSRLADAKMSRSMPSGSTPVRANRSRRRWRAGRALLVVGHQRS